MYDSTVYFYSAPVFIFFNITVSLLLAVIARLFRRNTKILQYYIYAIFNKIILYSNSLFCPPAAGHLKTWLLMDWHSFFFFFFQRFCNSCFLTKKVKVAQKKYYQYYEVGYKEYLTLFGYLK